MPHSSSSRSSLSDLLPVFAIAGVGFLLARYAGVQVQTVSRLTFHALAPAFVFNTLVNSTAESSQIGRMALFYLLVAISAATMARIAAIPLRLDRRALSAFMLVVVCSNSGNYGLPVTLLAFGREALTFASVYFVASSIFSYTGGVLLAASGRRSLRDAIVGIARVPAVYGAMAAALTLSLGIHLPGAVIAPITLLSEAALPMMILVLGMQLERASRPERPEWSQRRCCLADPHAACRAGHRASGRTSGRRVAGRRAADLDADGRHHDDPRAGIRRRSRLRDERGVCLDASEPADGHAADRLPADRLGARVRSSRTGSRETP